MKVLISSAYFSQENLRLSARLKQVGYEVVYNPFGRRMTEQELVRIIREVNPIGCIAGTEPFTAKVMAEASALKVISRQGAGVDNIDLVAATGRGIIVTNTSGTYPEAVAELALGMMLSLARGIVRLDREVKAGQFQRSTGNSLVGKNLGIIGTGHIGRALAIMAQGFGMRLLCYSRRVDSRLLEMGAEYLPLEEVLAQADFVSLHLPLTKETRNFIGREELEMMKPGAYLVNTARGGIVDEEALYEALTSGRLAGAGLDVFKEEPPRDFKLARLDQVIATPHIGSHTPESLEGMALKAIDNLQTVLSGQRPETVVNPGVYNNFLGFPSCDGNSNL